MHSHNLFVLAEDALRERDAQAKIAATDALAQGLKRGRIHRSPPAQAAEQVPVPGRPARPLLVHPRSLTQRTTATVDGRAALLHSIAHIEFNAINLALDAVYRFRDLPPAYYDDWIQVATEEARHFGLLREHLRLLGYDYGDFPAHNGLWEMALSTAHDPLVRMALVPRVLEARGLDASPGIIRRLRACGDERAAEIVTIILHDEIGHVEIGTRWFMHLCGERGLEPSTTFAQLLIEHRAPRPVLPLNRDARGRAGFSTQEMQWIETLAQQPRR